MIDKPTTVRFGAEPGSRKIFVRDGDYAEGYAAGFEAAKEAASRAVWDKAHAIVRRECCGRGIGSPPDCCGDPDYFLSIQEAHEAIAALKPEDHT